jgi:hypothetical protein
MTETQLAWRHEANTYVEQGTPEDWEEYQAWLDNLPADVHDGPPDVPEDNFPPPALDGELPF